MLFDPLIEIPVTSGSSQNDNTGLRNVRKLLANISPVDMLTENLAIKIPNSFGDIANTEILILCKMIGNLGGWSQKTYPVGWSLTPLIALLLLGIAKLCLVVAP
jgi:hypothetical protein